MPDFLTRDMTFPGMILIIAIVAIAVLTDVRRRKIYNLLTMPAMLLGFIVNTIANGFSGTMFAASGLLLGITLFVLPVALMGRGAGDLKLLAAVGAIGGPVFVFWCALLTGVAGAVFAIGVLLYKRRLSSIVGGMAYDAVTGFFPEARSNIRLPYAIPIAVGAVLALAIV